MLESASLVQEINFRGHTFKVGQLIFLVNDLTRTINPRKVQKIMRWIWDGKLVVRFYVSIPGHPKRRKTWAVVSKSFSLDNYKHATLHVDMKSALKATAALGMPISMYADGFNMAHYRKVIPTKRVGGFSTRYEPSDIRYWKAFCQFLADQLAKYER